MKTFHRDPYPERSEGSSEVSVPSFEISERSEGSLKTH